MNDQERQVIDDIFARLEQVANQPREPEAERYIAEKVRRQPYAPYAMAQAIVVQEQALANLSAELEQLRAEVDRLQRQPQGGGILSSLFGGGPRQPEPMRPQGASPWGRPVEPPPMQAGYGYGMPQQPMQPGGGFGGGPWGQRGGGGGFLQSAMTTAAGVAGGMMIANALSHAFGGESGAAGAAHGLGGFGGTDSAGSGEGGTGSLAGITDSLYPAGSSPDASVQDASLEENQRDDFAGDYGGDSGDDGDWT
jgi:hypothetical protein